MEESKPCKTCKHYNNGKGDIDCYFCDAELGEDRWEENVDNTGQNPQEHN